MFKSLENSTKPPTASSPSRCFPAVSQALPLLLLLQIQVDSRHKMRSSGSQFCISIIAIRTPNFLSGSSECLISTRPDLMCCSMLFSSLKEKSFRHKFWAQKTGTSKEMHATLKSILEKQVLLLSLLQSGSLIVKIKEFYLHRGCGVFLYLHYLKWSVALASDSLSHLETALNCQQWRRQ